MKSVIIGAIVLTLLIWGLFYLYGLPLSGAETTLVVGICFLVALGLRKAFRLIRRGSGADKVPK
jgi:hypothetical protein